MKTDHLAGEEGARFRDKDGEGEPREGADWP
jgi:hypothetical protein